ncbi:D-amino acid dehydrogenase [Silvimonas sp. JCM 19000]
MRVMVLGAGITGVTSAWYLAQAGHEVTVLERGHAAALETSFANGGQISVCHAEPWANIKAPWKILQWLAEDDAPLVWRMRADLAQWRWGLRFLLECAPQRARHNLQSLVRLGLYSRQLLQELRAQLGFDYDQSTRGILHYYTDPKEFESALPAAAAMRQLGLQRTPADAARCLAIEPALAHSHRPIVGGTYTESDESGDAHRFTQLLAARCEQAGVRFRYGVNIERIVTRADQVVGVQIAAEDELASADAYVVCLGSYTPHLLRPLGVKLDIYPGKGYSVTIPLAEGDKAPQVSLTDDGHKLVFSRLGQRLRVAGMAEFAGYDLRIDKARCHALLTRVQEIFPHLSGYQHAEFWTGLRPCTPGNLPYIGKTGIAGLFVNSGHGTLGWTEGCGSGRAVADMVDNRRPEVEYPFMLAA